MSELERPGRSEPLLVPYLEHHRDELDRQVMRVMGAGGVKWRNRPTGSAKPDWGTASTGCILRWCRLPGRYLPVGP